MYIRRRSAFVYVGSGRYGIPRLSIFELVEGMTKRSWKEKVRRVSGSKK